MSDEQSTVNVVDVPGADGFGKMLTVGLPASAAGALLARRTTISPATAAAHLTRRMGSPDVPNRIASLIVPGEYPGAFAGKLGAVSGRR
jgi:hypothetical protein